MNDLISRQAAIKYFVTNVGFHDEDGYPIEDSDELRKIWTEYFDGIPSAQPTLYGYKIEHLAYIARVMEKEGVTADYAVRTFDNMSRVIKMIINEAQQKVEEALNE